jgi:hypothetical protein
MLTEVRGDLSLSSAVVSHRASPIPVLIDSTCQASVKIQEAG